MHRLRTGRSLGGLYRRAGAGLPAGFVASLGSALDGREMRLVFQPQVSPVDGRLVGVEALARWASPVWGDVPPARFVSVAERTGLIHEMTRWVLGEALDTHCRWRRAGVVLPVSVNVSALSLAAGSLVDEVTAALDARGLDGGALMVEVTETMAFSMPDAVASLGPLRDIGVGVSIDDFGTGYTSLAVLPGFPLDELKLDQRFVTGASSSSECRAIAESVCELAHRLGAEAVAEGVEDARVAALMRRFGFDRLQGFHFARPLSAAEVLGFALDEDAVAV